MAILNIVLVEPRIPQNVGEYSKRPARRRGPGCIWWSRWPLP